MILGMQMRLPSKIAPSEENARKLCLEYCVQGMKQKGIRS